MIAGWVALAALAQETAGPSLSVRTDALLLHDEFAACMVDPHEHDFEWIPAGDVYQCGTQTVSRSFVDDLRRIVLASRQDPPDVLATLGVTPASVEQHQSEILAQLEGLEGMGSEGHPLPLHDGVEALLRFEVISQAVLDDIRYFRKAGSTTFHEIRVTLPGEPTITLTSQGHLGWLLPWQVEAGGRTWKSSRVEISRAVLPFLDADSPNRYLLDGTSYWREWFWSDWMFWVETYERLDAILASNRYERMAGFADVAPWFRVDSSQAGMSNTVVLDLSSLVSGPIQGAQWWNPLTDHVPRSSWNDFLAAWDDGVGAVRCHDWIEAWRRGGKDHQVRLLAMGRRPSIGDDLNPNVLIAWKNAGFCGQPTVEISLQRGGQAAAVVLLSLAEPGALIISAIPGTGDHWLDHMDVSFHPQTPTYVRVDPSGKPEVRSMAPFSDPNESTRRGCG